MVIDVSSHQGSIDWHKVRAAGVTTAIIKATQTGVAIRDADRHFVRINPIGNYRDERFSANQAGARQTMRRVGYYHYMHPDGGASLESQAQYFLDTVGPLQFNEFTVLDTERRDLPASVVIPAMTRWFAYVQARTGKTPWLYTSPSLAKQYKYGSYFANHPLWLAHYTTGKPIIPAGWSNYTLWQYTSSGRVDGIDGRVDLNREGSLNIAPLLAVGAAWMAWTVYASTKGR